MSRSATPGRLPINEYDIIAIFKAVEKNYSSFRSCKPQHFWWSSNGSNLCGTWEAIELIEHFVESQSSVRSSRKSKNINVSYAVWDGSCHKMGETRPHQQQFALWMVTSKDLTNRCDPCGVGRSRMCRPDGSSRQQPYSTGDQKLEVRKSVRQEFLPCTPSHCSGEKLVDCILMRCFGQPELVMCCSQSSVIASEGPYTFICAWFWKNRSYS